MAFSLLTHQGNFEGKGSKHARIEQAGNRVHEVEEINPDPHDGDISTPTTL